MRTTEITRRDGSTAPVRSWPSTVPGLSIVPFVWDDMTEATGFYRLTHEASGLAVGPYGWHSRAACIRTAKGLADIIDWTDSFVDLRDHPRLADIVKVCREEGIHDWDIWWRI